MPRFPDDPWDIHGIFMGYSWELMDINMDMNMEKRSFMAIAMIFQSPSVHLAFRTICLGGDSIIGELTPGGMGPKKGIPNSQKRECSKIPYNGT